MLQNLSERKKKAAAEKRQLEDDLDDVKTTFEVILTLTVIPKVLKYWDS